MADPSLITIPVPDEGLDTDTAPSKMPGNKAPYLANFLIDRPGRLPMRGPLNASLEYRPRPAEAEKPVGIWSYNDSLLIGLRGQSASLVRDPWVAPYRAAIAVTSDLSSGDLGVKHLNLSTGVLTAITASTLSQVPGQAWTRLGSNVYGFSHSAAATQTANGYLQYENRFLRWPGTAVQPTLYTFGPRGGQDVKAHYNRVFALGGSDPTAGVAASPILQNTLWFSDPTTGAALADTAAAWQDDATGLTNRIDMLADDNDFGVALARAGQNLIIFRRKSIWMLYGYSRATFLLKPFTTQYGCIDPRSVVESDDGVYFMSDQGFMFFDGSQAVNVSMPVQSKLLSQALIAVGDNGTDGGRVVAGHLDHGYIGISAGVSASVTDTPSTTTFSAMFHPRRNAWVYLTSDALEAGGPVGFGNTSSFTFVYDDSYILNANKVTMPEQATPTERGKDEIQLSFVWTDAPAFTGTGNALEDGLGTDMFPGSGSGAFLIPSEWRTTTLALASAAASRTILNRAVLDSQWSPSLYPASGAGVPGWTIQVVSESGPPTDILNQQSIISNFTFPESVLTTHSRVRSSFDCYFEGADLRIVVKAKAAAPNVNPSPPAYADVQNVHLVVQHPTHTRRSDPV